MENRLTAIQPLIGVTGRVLLGLYFLLPGISKITGFEGTVQYMETQGSSPSHWALSAPTDWGGLLGAGLSPFSLKPTPGRDTGVRYCPTTKVWSSPKTAHNWLPRSLALEGHYP